MNENKIPLKITTIILSPDTQSVIRTFTLEMDFDSDPNMSGSQWITYLSSKFPKITITSLIINDETINDTSEPFLSYFDNITSVIEVPVTITGTLKDGECLDNINTNEDFSFENQDTTTTLNSPFFEVENDLKPSMYVENIKLNDGRKYKLSGRSYDQLENSDILVDQTATSSTTYVISDPISGEEIELSSQQCILMDSTRESEGYLPYLLINNSARSQVAKLGNLELLQINMNINDNKNQGKDTKRYRSMMTDKFDKIIKNQDEMMKLKNIINDDNNDVNEILKIVDHETVSEIQFSFNKAVGNIRAIEATQAQNNATVNNVDNNLGFLQKFRGTLNRWIFNGLLLSIGKVITDLLFKMIFAKLLLQETGITNIFLQLIIMLPLLLMDSVIELCEELGAQISPVFATTGVVLRIIRTGVKESIDNCCLFIVNVGIGNNRSVLMISTEDDPNPQDRVNKHKYLNVLMIILQDVLLFFGTVIPKVLELYQYEILKRQELVKKQKLEREIKREKEIAGEREREEALKKDAEESNQAKEYNEEGEEERREEKEEEKEEKKEEEKEEKKEEEKVEEKVEEKREEEDDEEEEEKEEEEKDNEEHQKAHQEVNQEIHQEEHQKEKLR